MADLKSRILDLLTRERLCLTQGEFDKLPHLADEKARLIDVLQKGRAQLTAEAVEVIRSACARNDRLFEASVAGLAAVRDRLEAIRNVRNGFTTYGGDGRVRKAPNQTGTLERRA
ncbi:MAG: hypothetical protein AAF412_03885 [Pseudomonadota bacterium]